MTLDAFIHRLRSTPDRIAFEETIGLIDSLYDFTPTTFRSGNQHNDTGENTGSCKILAFAQLNGLSETETLACFGHYYRDDVLGDPNGSGHANIREFVRHGWPGVHFAAFPLQPK
jgi:hypothetical protein